MSDPINLVGDPAIYAALKKVQSQLLALSVAGNALADSVITLSDLTERLSGLVENHTQLLQTHTEQLAALSKVAVEASTKDLPLQ